MSEVAVLQPHDCLPTHQRRRQHPLSSPSRNAPKVIPHQPRRKKTTPRPSPPPPPPHTPSSNNLVMGQVKILRRGDHLPGSITPPSGEGLLPLPTPQVDVVQIRLPFAGSSRPEQVNGFYAGSAAFVASPPPSSVPLPGFFAKRGGEGDSGLAACDSATSDLRRILRLD